MTLPTDEALITADVAISILCQGRDTACGDVKRWIELYQRLTGRTSLVTLQRLPPQSDAHDPITEDWLASIGFAQTESCYGSGIALSRGILQVDRAADGWNVMISEDYAYLKPVSTRGELRNVISILLD